jgi:hypothetical protein
MVVMAIKSFTGQAGCGALVPQVGRTASGSEVLLRDEVPAMKTDAERVGVRQSCGENTKIGGR